MRQTKERESNLRLAVDIDGLAALLSCGQMTARKIGEDAGGKDRHRTPGAVFGTKGGKVSGSYCGISRECVRERGLVIYFE